MKKGVLILFVAMLAFGTTRAQPQVDEVTTALNGGDISNIVKYFDKVVDITLSNNQSTYSKSQAEMVLKNFLLHNPSKSFSVRYKGNASNDNSFFLIGELNTNTHGTFRVYFFFKQKGKTFYLQELKFEQ